LHAELANEHSGVAKWGYRKVHAGSLTIKASVNSGDAKTISNEENTDWSKLPKLDEKARKIAKAAGVPDELDVCSYIHSQASILTCHDSGSTTLP
jgi:hypothetical protein